MHILKSKLRVKPGPDGDGFLVVTSSAVDLRIVADCADLGDAKAIAMLPDVDLLLERVVTLLMLGGGHRELWTTDLCNEVTALRARLRGLDNVRPIGR